jgi:hypothetical protein
MALQGGVDRPVCMDCIEEDGPPHRYICSFAGCGNLPIYLAVVENDVTSSVLVCERHFPKMKDDLTSYLQVPAWLTNGNDFHLGEGGVVFEFEMGPGDQNGG